MFCRKFWALLFTVLYVSVTSALAQAQELLKDLNSSPLPVVGEFLNPNDPGQIVLGNPKILFFRGQDSAHGLELWRSDGSTAGTILLKEFRTGSAGSNPRDFAVLGGEVYFVASTLTDGLEVFKTDGTADGSVLAISLAPAANSFSSEKLITLNNKIIFSAVPEGGTGREPWITDGS